MTPDTFYKVRPIATIHNNIRVFITELRYCYDYNSYVMGVRAYVNRTTDKQDVIFVCPTPETYKISNNHYETLISKAFEYIQNTAF